MNRYIPARALITITARCGRFSVRATRGWGEVWGEWNKGGTNKAPPTKRTIRVRAEKGEELARGTVIGGRGLHGLREGYRGSKGT